MANQSEAASGLERICEDVMLRNDVPGVPRKEPPDEPPPREDPPLDEPPVREPGREPKPMKLELRVSSLEFRVLE
jgi:hypothetical protein